MEILKELVAIHRENRTMKVRILGDRKGHCATTLYKLYDAVYKQKVKTDEEAMSYLYGEASYRDEKIRKRYSTTKRRLEQKLIDGLFLIELREDKVSGQTITDLYKLNAAARILGMRHAVQASIKTAKQGLKEALRLGNVELAMEFCEVLVRRYAFRGEVKKMKEYRRLWNTYHELLIYSRKVDDLYLDLAAFFAKAQGISEEEVEFLGERLEELKKGIPRDKLLQSSKNTLILIESIYLQLTAAHRENIALCQNAYKEWEKSPILIPVGTKGQLLTGELISRIYLGHKKEAEDLAKKLRALKAKRLDWYQPYRISILSRLWFRDYQGAFELFLEVLRNRAYKRQKVYMEEDWRMLHAYLYFFYRQGLISTVGVDEKLCKEFTKFRIARFMNEMPVYTRDKRGYNISLLTVQALLWLQERQEDRFFDKVEALAVYNYKHLRRNQTFRSHCYLKMLIRLVRVGIRRIERDKRINDLFKQMQEFPMKTLEVEIVPYEHQWEFVLSLMKQLYRII